MENIKDKLDNAASEFADKNLKMWEGDECPTFDIMQQRFAYERGFRAGAAWGRKNYEKENQD